MTQACWISTGTTYWDFRRPWGSPHFATVLAATGCMFVGQCGPNIDWLETSNECINIFWVGHMCHDLIIVSSWYHRIVPLKCSEYPNLSPFLENPFLENPLGSRVTMSFSEKKTPPNLMVYQFYFPILWVLLYPQVPTDRNMRLLVRSLKSSFNSFQKKCSPNIPDDFQFWDELPPIPRSQRYFFILSFRERNGIHWALWARRAGISIWAAPTGDTLANTPKTMPRCPRRQCCGAPAMPGFPGDGFQGKFVKWLPKK